MATIFWQCQNDNEILLPDVSDINVDVNIRRFEQDLFTADTNTIAAELSAIQQKYPFFAPLFFGEVLGVNDPRVLQGQSKTEYLRGFVTFPSLRQLYETCSEEFDDMTTIKADFHKTFQYLKYYFPNDSVPDITTFISEYSIGLFIYGQHSLAIGLDFFLGSDYPYQSLNSTNPNFSAYLTRSFNKDHVVPKTMKVWVEDKLGYSRGENLLEQMIHNGKEMYIMDQLMPHLPDTAVFEFSQKQLSWLENNETDMWAFFISEDLIYSTDADKIRKYVNYSPNAPGMPKEAPGRTANWMGYKIIQAFMRKNPGMSLTELIQVRDGQKILTMSKYKPPRR